MVQNSVEVVVDIRDNINSDFGKYFMPYFFDYLLYLRSQIPFEYKTFQLFMLKMEELKSNTGSNWKILKQQQMAKDTYTKINLLKEIIQNKFTDTIMINFGQTVFSPKESFTIKFPKSKRCMKHVNDESDIVRQILLKIVQNETLNEHCRNELKTTNVFVLFKKTECMEQDLQDLMEMKKYKVPSSCHRYSITFKTNKTEFSIFEDNFINLSLNDTPPIPVSTIHSNDDTWYQSKIFVKGFNDILIDNKSIWS